VKVTGIAACTLVLSGCHLLFSLDNVPPDATAGDGPGSDGGVVSDVRDGAGCPASYKQVSGWTVRVITTLDTYIASRQDCEDDAAGLTFLAEPYNDDLMIVVKAILMPYAQTDVYWVGATQLTLQGGAGVGWSWPRTMMGLDGAYWAADEPDDGLDKVENDEENNVVVTPFAQLSDRSATEAHGAICACEAN
jgi:hypothetical protein